MRIGVLGTGNMADALATHWVRAGHQVTIGGRDHGKAELLAARIGGGAGSGGLRAAAESGQDVVLAALPFGAGAKWLGSCVPPWRARCCSTAPTPSGRAFGC